MILFIKTLFDELSTGFKVLLGLFIVFAFFALLGLVSIVYPFAPFQEQNYEAVPNSVCTGETVDLFVERELVGGPYTLGTYDVTAVWVYKDGQRIPAGSATNVPLKDKADPHSTFRSSIVPVAPPVVGEVRLVADMKIRGRMFGVFGTHQDVFLVTKQPLKINDC